MTGKCSVYIHIPFCAAKCVYCDFLSFTAAAFRPADYLQWLSLELAARGRELRELGTAVDTLYIGGGTPTALSAGELETLMAACRNTLPLAEPEWTVEGNPGTIDREKAAIMKDAGVNRVSLGIQDTDDHRLALLGRRHTAAQARQAFSLCRHVFPSVSLDIMSGLPGQTIADCEKTVAELCSWEPDHLSFYGLKVEEGTPLEAARAAGKVTLPTEEEGLAMLLQGREILLTHGFIHYEIANYARPGHLCRHNLTYWENRPYLGLGLGAHSYWDGCRFSNTTDIGQYRNSLANGILPVAERHSATRRQEMEDTMMLGLRLTAGVSFTAFQHRFGEDLRAVFAGEIGRLQEKGLIRCDGKNVRLTEDGLPLANLVFAEFITV